MKKLFTIFVMSVFLTGQAYAGFHPVDKVYKLRDDAIRKTPGLNKIIPRKPKEHKSVKARQKNYIDIVEEAKLSDYDLAVFDEIRKKEWAAVRPLALDLEVKYLREDDIRKISCRFYQRQCRKDKKKGIAFLQEDIRELKRQIWQKKEYYKILYLNELTREQDRAIRYEAKKKTRGDLSLW